MRASQARRWSWAAATVAGMTLVMPAALPLDAQQISYTGGLYGATGEYIFTERSTSLALVNGLAIAAGRFRLSASIPLVYQSTPWVSLSGAGPIPTGGPQRGEVAQGSGGSGRRAHRITLPDTGSYDRVGIGDPTLLATIDLVPWRAGVPSFYLSAAAKAPVASVDQGFGTGEWDYAAGMGASVLLGRMALEADGMYWVMGDVPELPLRDVVSYSASVGRVLGDGSWTAMATVFGSGATIRGSDAPAQAGVLVRRFWPSGRSVTVGLSAGVTSSAPDVSFSMGWRVPLSAEGSEAVVAESPRDDN